MPAPPLEHRTLVLLLRRADAPAISDDEADEIQEAHLDFLQRMRDDGHLIAAGPVRQQPDETLRGLCLYRTGLDETRALAAQDPAVVRRRLVVQAMEWHFPEGELPG